MNTIDLGLFTDYITELFPRTDISSPGMAAMWAEAVWYVDLDDAKAAVKAHRKESSYETIKINQFEEEVRKIVGRRKAEERKSARQDTPVPEQYCGIFIECVVNPIAYPNWQGLQVPVMRSLQQHPSPEEIRRAAELMIDRRRQVYGPSQWKIVDDPDGRLYYKIAWMVFDDERRADATETDLAFFKEGT